MTDPKASARSRRNVAAGKEAERLAATFLRPIMPGIERYVRAGWDNGLRMADDPGDLRGADGLILSVKYAIKQRIPLWMAELDAMAGSPRDVRVLISRIKYRPVADWDVWIRGGVYAAMVTHPWADPTIGAYVATDAMAFLTHEPPDEALMSKGDHRVLSDPIRISFAHLRDVLVWADYVKGAAVELPEVQASAVE